MLNKLRKKLLRPFWFSIKSHFKKPTVSECFLTYYLIAFLFLAKLMIPQV
jgi:hypothetical protein